MEQKLEESKPTNKRKRLQALKEGEEQEPILPKNPIEMLIRRIMYAEGDLDLPSQSEESAQYLKSCLPAIVAKLTTNPPSEEDNEDSDSHLREINMGLVKHVFQHQLRRFYKTKKLTRGLK